MPAPALCSHEMLTLWSKEIGEDGFAVQAVSKTSSIHYQLWKAGFNVGDHSRGYRDRVLLRRISPVEGPTGCRGRRLTGKF